MILFPAHPFPNFANSPFETPVTEKKMIFLIKMYSHHYISARVNMRWQ